MGEEIDAAAAGVLETVAGDFRNGGGHAGLVLGVETEQAGDLTGALARQDHVLLQSYFQAQELVHGCGLPVSRATTTVTSSRSRLKSRRSTPAIRATSRPSRPGYRLRSHREARP